MPEMDYEYTTTDDSGANNTGDLIYVGPCDHSILGLSSLGLMVIYVLVFVFSVLGNSVVIYVVCCMARGRTTTDVYLMHLAVADLLFSLTLPFWAVYVYYSHWGFGTFLCKLLSGLQDAAFYGGVFLLACISVDRYLAIVKATRALTQRRHLVGIVCGFVWLGAGLLSLPMVLQKEAIQVEDLANQTICYENLGENTSDQWRLGIRMLRHGFGFFLPLAIMVVCYSCTAATLFRGVRNGQKHKAMRVILAVVLAFVVCWLPRNLSVLVDSLMRIGVLGEETCEFQNDVSVALYVTEVLAFTHCAVNPVLYAFIGQKFRNQLLVVLHKHGLISKRVLMAYHRGSTQSIASQRSRNTSITM